MFRAQVMAGRSFSTMSVSQALTHIDAMNTTDENDNKEIVSYFKKNFRKMSFLDAFTLMQKVEHIQSLNEEFWVWETIEEAIRPELKTMPVDDF